LWPSVWSPQFPSPHALQSAPILMECLDCDTGLAFLEAGLSPASLLCSWLVLSAQMVRETEPP
jgi:hypothetical protein